MKTFRELWQGNQPLTRAFWGFGFLGFIGVYIAGFIVTRAAIENASSFDTVLRLASVNNGILAAYLAFASVGIWRSATRYTGRAVWRFSAKAASVIGIIYACVLFIFQVDRITGL